MTTETSLVNAPGTDAEIIGYYQEALKLQEYADKRVIATAEDTKSATDDLSIIARLKKAMEERRKQYLKPLKDQTEAINTTYKFLMAPIERADQVTRSKVLSFRQEQERIRLAAEAIERDKMELARREAELNGGTITVDLTPIDKPLEQPKHIRTDIGMASGAQIWKFEVVDFSLLPNEYKMADEVKIGKVVRATKGSVAIAGVRIWPEESLRITTK